MAIRVINESNPKPGPLGKPELYALSIGQVIGAGVITLIVPAIKMTGYSAWLAYLVAVIAGFIMIAPYIFLSSTLRLGGGQYSMVCDLAGPTAAGVYAFVFLTQCLTLALFGTSTAAYIGDIIPALGSPGARMVIGVAIITFFFAVNLMGVNVMAKVQKIMTWLLIAALLVFIVFGLANRRLPIFNTADPNYLVNGWGITFTNGQITGGFTGAVLLFVYSCQGYFQTAGFGREAKKAKKDIPIVLLLTVPTLIVLYVGVAMAGAGVMSLEEYGESTTLVFAARSIFPAWLFICFIIAGPIMALLSTLNSIFAYNAVTIVSSCDDGWLPKKFGEKNKNGSRKYILAFMYIVGIIPIILGLSIVTLTNMVQLFLAAYAFLSFLAFIKMPKKYPKAWKNARFHVPDGLYYTICIISLIGYLIVFWKGCLSMTPTMAVILVVMLVVLAGMGIYRAKTGDIEIHTSVWADEG